MKYQDKYTWQDVVDVAVHAVREGVGQLINLTESRFTYRYNDTNKIFYKQYCADAMSADIDYFRNILQDGSLPKNMFYEAFKRLRNGDRVLLSFRDRYKFFAENSSKSYRRLQLRGLKHLTVTAADVTTGHLVVDYGYQLEPSEFQHFKFKE